MEGVAAFVKEVLTSFVQPELLNKAVAKSLKQPAVKALMQLDLAAEEGRKRRKGSKPPKGTSLYRSSFSVFVSVMMHQTKGQGYRMQDVSAVWAGLPPAVKEEVVLRCEAIK
jgi:hypothetical protein